MKRPIFDAADRDEELQVCQLGVFVELEKPDCMNSGVGDGVEVDSIVNNCLSAGERVDIGAVEQGFVVFGFVVFDEFAERGIG